MVVMVIFMWFLQKMSLTCNNGITLGYSNIKMAMIDNFVPSNIYSGCY